MSNLIEKYVDLLIEANLKNELAYGKERGYETPSKEQINSWKENNKIKHIKSFEILKMQIEEKEYNALAPKLSPHNKFWRGYFEEFTGVKLPKTLKGTIEVLKEYTGYQEPVIEKQEKVKLSKAEKLIKMNSAKMNNVLSKLVRVDGGKVMTKKEFIETLTKQEYKPQICLVEDESRIRFLEERIHSLRRCAPIGNENHPQTIQLRTFEKEYKNGPKKKVYKMWNAAENSSYNINKTEYDYAVSIQN